MWSSRSLVILIGAIVLSVILLFWIPWSNDFFIPQFLLSMFGGIPLITTTAVMFTHRGDATFRSYRPWLRAVGFVLLGVGYPVAVFAFSVVMGFLMSIPSEVGIGAFGLSIPFLIPMVYGYILCALGGLLLILRGILYERRQTQVLQQ